MGCGRLTLPRAPVETDTCGSARRVSSGALRPRRHAFALTMRTMYRKLGAMVTKISPPVAVRRLQTPAEQTVEQDGCVWTLDVRRVRAALASAVCAPARRRR